MPDTGKPSHYVRAHQGMFLLRQTAKKDGRVHTHVPTYKSVIHIMHATDNVDPRFRRFAKRVVCHTVYALDLAFLCSTNTIQRACISWLEHGHSCLVSHHQDIQHGPSRRTAQNRSLFSKNCLPNPIVPHLHHASTGGVFPWHRV